MSASEFREAFDSIRWLEHKLHYLHDPGTEPKGSLGPKMGSEPQKPELEFQKIKLKVA